MKLDIFKNRYYLLIIIISLTWILFLNHVLQLNLQNFIFADSENYKESAHYLYHNFKPHYFRPLVMAIVTGIPYLFNSTDAQIYAFSFYLNLTCWIGTSLLLYKLLNDFLSLKKSFYFSCIYIFLLGNSVINFHLLTETIFIFAVIGAFYFLLKYYKTNKFYYLSIALSILILCVLIKPGVKFLVIILMLFFLKDLKKNFKKYSISFIVLSCGMVVFQLAEMKKEYGNYTISYIDNFTYYNYLGNRATAIKNNNPNLNYDIARANYFTKINYDDQKKLAFEDLKNQLQYNSKNLFKAYLYDLLENTKTPSASINICRNIKNNNIFDFAKKTAIVISKWQNRIFTILGVILAFVFLFTSYKKNPFYLILSFYVLYIFFISGVSFGEGDRFHIVFFPVTIILLAKFINQKPFYANSFLNFRNEV